MDKGVAEALNARVASLKKMRSATNQASKTATSQGLTEEAELLKRTAKAYDEHVIEAEKVAAYLGKATDAFVAYAGDLRDIADKGREDAAAAEAYGRSVAGLAASLAALVPVPAADATGELIGELAQAGGEVAQRIALERARNELLHEIEARSEDASTLADALVADLKTAKQSMRGRALAIEAADFLRSTDYAAADSFELSLQFRRMQVAASIRKAIDSNAPPAMTDAEEMETLGKLLESVQVWRRPYDDQVAIEKKRVDTIMALMDHAVDLARAWKSAHKRLPEIIDDGRQSPFDVLSSIADETKELMNALKATQAD